MSDPNRIWAQGDDLELGARQLNFWTQGAQLAQQALGKQSGPPLVNGPHFVPLRIRNATGSNLPQFAVVSFATPLQTPTDNLAQWSLNTTLNAIVPAAPLTRFAILTTGLKADAVAENIAAIGGVVPCRITGTGTKAQAIAGDTAKLQAGTTGHDIVWQESGSAERYALIMLGTASSGEAAEPCCCPKCNTSMPPFSACNCMPPVCITVLGADDEIVSVSSYNWSDGEINATLNFGPTCDYAVVITNSWGGEPAVPGIRIRSEVSCLGLPECGLFQEISCVEWNSETADPSVLFSLDDNTCTCGDTAAVAIKIEPVPRYNPPCEGCYCVDEWMCLTHERGVAVQARQSGSEWVFPPLQGCDDPTALNISAKLVGKTAACNECVWKLQFPEAGIAYTDEAYWITTEDVSPICGPGGTAVWNDIVVDEGTDDERTVNLLLQQGCDCVPLTCLTKTLPLVLSGYFADSIDNVSAGHWYYELFIDGSCGTLVFEIDCYPAPRGLEVTITLNHPTLGAIDVPATIVCQTPILITATTPVAAGCVSGQEITISE